MLTKRTFRIFRESRADRLSCRFNRSRRRRRGLSGEVIEGAKPESEASKSDSADAAAPVTTTDAESGRRDSVEAAVAALIGEPLEPRNFEESATKRATRKTSRDLKAADEHQQQSLQQQPTPATVSQPSTRSSRSSRAREMSTEAETVVADRPHASPGKDKLLVNEQKSPTVRAPKATTLDQQDQGASVKQDQPKNEVARAVVEGALPSKLEQVVARCETRRTSARRNSLENKQSKVIEDVKVEQSLKGGEAAATEVTTAAAAVVVATAAAPASPSIEETLKISGDLLPRVVLVPLELEGQGSPKSTAASIATGNVDFQPAENKNDAAIASSQSEKIPDQPAQTTHKNATAAEVSESTDPSSNREASQKETKEKEDEDDDFETLKIVEADDQHEVQRSQKPDRDVADEIAKQQKSAEDPALGEGEPCEELKSEKLADPVIANHRPAEPDAKQSGNCAVGENPTENEPVSFQRNLIVKRLQIGYNHRPKSEAP